MNDKKAAIRILADCDVLVCGSTLFAIELALKAARRGQRTVLAMERVNPFIEAIACLRAFVPDAADLHLSPVLQQILSHPHCQRQHGRIYFNPHQAARSIEDMLIEAGVQFFYNAMPVAALMESDRVVGGTFAGKPGLYGIRSSWLVDCTLAGTLTASCIGHVAKSERQRKALCSFELTQQMAPRNATVTSTDGLRGQVAVHKLYAEFTFHFSALHQGPLAYSNDYIAIYQAATEWLDEQGIARFRGPDTYLNSMGYYLDAAADGKISDFDNLYCFSPMALPDNPHGQLALVDPLCLHKQFDGAIDLSLCPRNKVQGSVCYHLAEAHAADEDGFFGEICLQDDEFVEPGAMEVTLSLTAPALRIETDLLIAGIGTAGVAAACQAGRHGVKSLCLDNGLEAGGTQTLGGVTNLWFGNRNQWFKKWYQDIGAKNNKGNSSAFFRAINSFDVSMQFYTPVCGLTKLGRAIKQVLAVTPLGLVAVRAKYVLDATGDGSLAAWGGNPYTFGSERDGLSLWGSFGSFVPGKFEAKRQYLSIVDERSPFDATRFIVSMRRNLSDVLDEHDHVHPAFYIAARSTRHIQGLSTLTYQDVLAERQFGDGIYRCRSNIDTKGVETALAFKSGFYPWHRFRLFNVSVPYGTLIPVSFDNVFICGKAYSVTNDALSMARMEVDMFSLGMIAAEAATMCNASGLIPAELPVQALQARLLEIGVLSPGECLQGGDDFRGSVSHLVEELEQADDLEAGLRPLAQLLVAGKEHAKSALVEREDLNEPLSRLLCFWNEQKGRDVLIAELKAELVDGLPTEIHGSDIRLHSLPDHGFVPKALSTLICLAVSGAEEILVTLADISVMLAETELDANALWAWVFGFCFAVDRMARRELISAVTRVLDLDLFQTNGITRQEDWRGCQHIPAERIRYLSLCLSRSLARCGSLDGCRALLGFFDEVRVSFAVHARDELMDITGQDFGYRHEAWQQWFNEQGACIKASPDRRVYH